MCGASDSSSSKLRYADFTTQNISHKLNAPSTSSWIDQSQTPEIMFRAPGMHRRLHVTPFETTTTL